MNPHGDAFEHGAAATGTSGASDCARCHGESSFRALTSAFNHGIETGFVLEGAHGTASCSACHLPLTEPDLHGRTLGPAAGVLCVTCHADPHGGQFARVDRRFPSGGVDCSRCPTPRGAFRADDFNHAWDTAFPLDGSHASLACAACHKREREDLTSKAAGAASSLVRYRPLPTRCVGCHGDQSGTLRRKGNGRGR
jgi:hypothetical protein